MRVVTGGGILARCAWIRLPLGRIWSPGVRIRGVVVGSGYGGAVVARQQGRRERRR